MNIEAIKLDFKFKSSDERIKSTIIDFKLLKEKMDKVAKLIGNPETSSKVIDFIVPLIFITDRVFSMEEYSILKKLYTAVGMSPNTYEGYKFLAEIKKEESEEIINSLLNILTKLIRSDATIKELFVNVYSKIALIDGELTVDELEFINRVQQLGNDKNTKTDIKSSKSQSTQSVSGSKPELEQIRVEKTGATIIPDDEDYYLSVGAKLYNPNEGHLAVRTTIKVIIYDSQGRVLRTSSRIVDYMDYGYFNYGEEFSVTNGKPSSFKVLAEADNFQKMGFTSKVMDGISFSNYTMLKDRWDESILTGTVTNNYKKKIDSMQVFLVLESKERKIVGGMEFYLRDLFSNSEDAFEERARINLDKVSYIVASVDFNINNLLK